MNFFAMKCAPPCHKSTPDPIQELVIIHHNRISVGKFEKIAKELIKMSESDYENSRVLLQFSLEHIAETIEGLYHNFNSSVIEAGIYNFFEIKIDEITHDIDKILKNSRKSLYLGDVKDFNFLLTNFEEALSLLQDSCKINDKLYPLLDKYNNLADNYYSEFNKRQKSISILVDKYEIVSREKIIKEAISNKEKSLKIDYSKLNYRKIKRLEYTVGSRNILWQTAQNSELQEKMLKNGSYKLSKRDIELFKEELPSIFRQYSKINFNTFTNLFRLTVLSAEFLATRWAEEALKNAEFMEKASNLFKHVHVLNELFDNITSKNKNKKIVLYYDKKIDKCIAKLEGCNESIIFYKEKTQTYGCLIKNTDLKSGNILSFENALEQSKGSSFHGIAQFINEIKDEFVQNYYFGKQEHLLTIKDERI